ncbi:MAG: NFACT RNA binding domain-containing protein, partial [Ruthenibacterium sp.]
GDAEASVTNYYDGTQLTIPLDVRLTPSANAQKYFKEYKKKQTAMRMLTQLLADGEREIAYLETVLYEVSAAEGEQALCDIRAELKSQGYLKYYKARDKKQKAADFLRYRSADGFLMLVGRNNLQNDKLTLKTARGRDLWFHVKNAPGSHVVVITEGQPVTDATKTQAAQLAALHSSQNGGERVVVDYTVVRKVRKTNDCKPGMVLYDPYETAVVAPDAQALAALAVH